jgi:hypothetical protein
MKIILFSLINLFKMKKKIKKNKNLIFLSLFFLFISSGFILNFFKNNEIFSKEIIFYEPPVKIKSNIDVNEIQEKIDEMTMEEIEETIVEIEKEIKRLESNIN